MTAPAEVDVAIVGAGVAGLTAALFCRRAGLDTLVFDRQGPGGQLLNVHLVENFPGFPEAVHGYDLGPAFVEQALAADVRFDYREVQSLERGHDDAWSLHTEEGDLRASSVIVATGSTLATLGLEHEERLHGHGVSYCATCDAEFFHEQDVVVVGGGDSALDETLLLAETVNHVWLVHREPTLTGARSTRARVDALANVEQLPGHEIEALHGDDELDAVSVRQLSDGATRRLEVTGLFVYVGLRPAIDLLRPLAQLDEAGRVDVDLDMWTGVPGLYAAGDIRRASASMLVTSAGDGATAAIAAERYIRSREH